MRIYRNNKFQSRIKQFLIEFNMRKKTDLFPMRPQDTTLMMSLEDYKYLSQLLKSGYSIKESILFLDQKGERLLQRLEQGEDLQTMLLEHQKMRFKENFTFFYTILPLDQALELSIEMENTLQDLKKQFLKKSIYPIFLFVFSLILLYFFSNFIIPQMLISFEMDAQLQMLTYLLTCLKFGSVLAILFMIVCLLVCLYLKTHSALFYHILHKFPLLWVQEYISFRFSIYLSTLHTYGLSTKEMMKYFMCFNEHSLFYFCMKDLYDALLEGRDFMECIVHDALFSKFFIKNITIGMQCNRVVATLQTYQMLQKQMWYQRLTKMSVLLQCIAYMFIALVVFVVYQMLLVPLNMLETMS